MPLSEFWRGDVQFVSGATEPQAITILLKRVITLFYLTTFFHLSLLLHCTAPLGIRWLTFLQEHLMLRLRGVLLAS